MDDLTKLIAAAERVSKVWRLGTDKTKDNIRDALNELDRCVGDAKRHIAQNATTAIRRIE